MENKVSQEIFNPVQENIKRLAELFPAVLKDGQLDFEALKQELGHFEEAGKEKYELTWPGKTLAKQIANMDIAGKTLKYVPEDSKNPEMTENLYIEGDNLEVLKLLRNSYYGKIKMIYIDPPYNTGNDFVYKDDYSKLKEISDIEEGEVSEDGVRLIKNQKSSARFHSNWLNMMYPRLKVVKDLLSDDGVIFISIDDNEVHNLRKICDEIFGEKNFVDQIIRKTKSFDRDKSSKEFQKIYDSILVYSKDKNLFKMKQIITGIREYPFCDKYGNYKLNPLQNKGPNGYRDQRPKTYYPIYVSPTGEINLEMKSEEDIEIFPAKIGGRDGRWSWSKQKLINERDRVVFKNNTLFVKIYEDKNKDNNKYVSEHNMQLNFLNSSGSAELRSIGLQSLFDNPKPVELLKWCVNLSTNSSDLILDFFAGSSTTAHAVMQLNAEDGGKRKFIMVQLPEKVDENSEAYKAGFKTIADIGKERIRRAGEKIKEEFKDKEGIENLDIGFKVFRVADTNIRWTSEAIKTGQIRIEDNIFTDKDSLDFNTGFTDIDVVYEIMLRHRDFPLTSKIEKLSHIGKRTYIFADSAVVCLEEKITNEIVDKIAAIEPKPLKVIFRDSAFDDDISLKLNTMNRLDVQLKKHNQGKEISYRVEFI